MKIDTFPSLCYSLEQHTESFIRYNLIYIIRFYVTWVIRGVISEQTYLLGSSKLGNYN